VSLATTAARLAERRQRLHLDPMLIGVAATLLLLGLVMVTSASVSLAGRDGGDPFYFLERQVLFALVGAGLAALLMRVPTELWERLGFPLLLLGLALLVLVLLPGLGASVNGSRRWLRLGPLNFQASEAARVCLLFYLCGYLVRREAEVRSSILGFLKPLGVLAVAALLLLIEPDFGSGVVLLATGIGVVFLAGVTLRHFLVLCGGAVLGLALIAVSSSYRVKRLTAFLDPWADPFNTGFQLTQSLIAIGRGEWFGVGLGASVQKLFYLPEAHTDFVFAVLAEELGFAGIALVIGLVLLLAFRALYIARRAAEAGMRFQAYLAAAFGIWIGLQAFINIGVNMGLLPTKGLTLPLVSYGRSSLLVTLGWLGVVLRVAHEVATAKPAAMKSVPR
jgi:cell division protein FtsW